MIKKIYSLKHISKRTRSLKPISIYDNITLSDKSKEGFIKERDYFYRLRENAYLLDGDIRYRKGQLYIAEHDNFIVMNPSFYIDTFNGIFIRERYKNYKNSISRLKRWKI